MPERDIIEGRPVLVVEDCVTSSSRRAHDGALEAMEYLQTGARRSLEDMIGAFRARGSGRAAAAGRRRRGR